MSNPTPDQLNALLKFAGERLNTTPEQLRDTVDPSITKKAEAILQDREKLNALLNSPQAQTLLKQLLGGD